MNVVPEIIKPIKLLAGTHADTAQTGQGCFMNVIAYLNGEPQITDESPCVCVTVRRMAITLNDRGTDEQRQRLLPFVMRAMGSATKDEAVLRERTARLRAYGAECQEIIHAWRAEMKAAYADAYANAYAKKAARDFAFAKRDELKAKLFDAGLRYLDAVLPAADAPTSAVLERAERLCELARA
jgi:hypothetical protein